MKAWKAWTSVALWFMTTALPAKADGTADLLCKHDLAPNQVDYTNSDVFGQNDCADRLVYCVDPSGFPMPGESRDPGLRSGETITIKLFGPASCNKVLSVSTDTKKSSATLFNPSAGTAPSPAAKPFSAVLPPKPAPPVLLGDVKTTVDAATVSVTVYVARTDFDLAVKGIAFDVVQPTYYLDVGLLVAFTAPFQTVTAASIPGVDDQYVHQSEGVHPSAAIALNWFPDGEYTAPRYAGWHGVGVQAGIGADLRHLGDEFYLGGVWEIVPGAGFSAGLALIRMDGLLPNYPEGTLIGSSGVQKDTFLGPRPYFGVNLNTQVFQTVLGLGAKIRVPQ